jgi:sRNA-binding regulator protein Hfq
MQSSTILTMGTALNRAHDHDAIVEVLVGGQWLTGVVAGVDGYGVVLVDAQNDHSVVRMDAISAVGVRGGLAVHQIEACDLYDASVCCVRRMLFTRLWRPSGGAGAAALFPCNSR